MSENIHANHRERIRERAAREGTESFADHELLELLLFYSIPRVDTNPLAHRLLKEFGSIKSIMDATVDELCRVQGMGKASALLFRTTVEMFRRYEADSLRPVQTYRKMSDVVDYLYPLFIGVNVERVYIMLLNNKMALLDCVMISEGEVNCTEASVRKITELVLNRKVAAVILAHNHPDGLAIPSSEDLNYTDLLNKHLRMLDVVMVEHILFAGMNYQPIMQQHCGMFRCSPLDNLYGDTFYKAFYNREERDYHIAPSFYKLEEE